MGCTLVMMAVPAVDAYPSFSHFVETEDDTFDDMDFGAAYTPAFHEVLKASPHVASYMYSNQIQMESKVSGGVIYTRQHPGAEAESGFGELICKVMPKYDSHFSQGVSVYWTFQIRLAHVNSGSKWHTYAKGLPTGIQTITRKSPTHWSSQRVTGWSSARSFKVIVY